MLSFFKAPKKLLSVDKPQQIYKDSRWVSVIQAWE